MKRREKGGKKRGKGRKRERKVEMLLQMAGAGTTTGTRCHPALLGAGLALFCQELTKRTKAELRAAQQSKALPRGWGGDKALEPEGNSQGISVWRAGFGGAATAAAPQGSKDQRSIPNSCKAQQTLGFSSSRRFLANPRRQERWVEARVGSG